MFRNLPQSDVSKDNYREIYQTCKTSYGQISRNLAECQNSQNLAEKIPEEQVPTPMEIGAIIAGISQVTDCPAVDLSRDVRLKKTKFPLDKLQKGREKEVEHLTRFSIS